MGKKKKRSPAPPPAKTYTQAEVDKLKSDWQAKSQTDYDTRLAGQKDLWGAQEAQRKAEYILEQSKHYADNPVYPLESTVANLNIDMIGRVDYYHDTSGYIYLIGSDMLSQELHDISEEINKKYIGLDLDYTFNSEDDPNRYYYRSDHYNFAKNNIPVIFYFNGLHDDYHKVTDTLEKIDFKKIETITRLVFLTAWELANRDKRIVVDKK